MLINALTSTEVYVQSGKNKSKGSGSVNKETKGMNRGILLKWLQIVTGLMVFSIGVHFTIFANIGLAAWDCLGMGIALHTPLNYGLSMTAVSVVLLCLDVAMKEKIGCGTVIDALLTGNLVQLCNDLNPFPENHSLPVGLLLMFAGFAVMAVGMWIYMSAAQGCGPRDSLLVGLGKRLPQLPIGAVEMMIRAVVLLVGWLLGGPVGIGTVIGTFAAGTVMEIVYRIIRFEPRNIVHQSVAETFSG